MTAISWSRSSDARKSSTLGGSAGIACIWGEEGEVEDEVADAGSLGVVLTHATNGVSGGEWDESPPVEGTATAAANAAPDAVACVAANRNKMKMRSKKKKKKQPC